MNKLAILRIPTTLFCLVFCFGCSGDTDQEKNTMSTDDSCQYSRMQKSDAFLTTILADVRNTYDQVSGEISGISLKATNIYVVSISQEERIDQLTYTLEMKPDCSVTILNKEISAVSPWEN